MESIRILKLHLVKFCPFWHLTFFFESRNSHWSYFIKVMLGNVVRLPNWNMTLSQKLSNCPKFTVFVPEFLSPFHNLHLKLLFEAIMNWEYRFWSVLWAATPQLILPLPWSLFLALPSMNPWCLQRLSGWPLAAGALSLCLVFCRWFFGFMAPPALLELMSRVGAKEAQASAL